MFALHVNSTSCLGGTWYLALGTWVLGYILLSYVQVETRQGLPLEHTPRYPQPWTGTRDKIHLGSGDIGCLKDGGLFRPPSVPRFDCGVLQWNGVWS